MAANIKKNILRTLTNVKKMLIWNKINAHCFRCI